MAAPQIIIDTNVVFAALRTLAYIEQRAQQGSREQFDRVLQKISEANLEPLEEDKLPEGEVVVPSCAPEATS